MKITYSLWCDCKELQEMELEEEDHHGEMKTFVCKNCGRKIKMEFSLVSY